MPLSIQYFNGTDYTQFGLTVADYTLSDSTVANTFYCIKDSKDNIYITCYGTDIGAYAKIIRISKTGEKAVANFGNYYWSKPKPISKTPIMLSRDENTLFVVDGGHGAVWTIPTNFVSGVVQDSNFQSACEWYSANSSAAIYQDRYIWVASGTTVKIYDYTTKAELAMVTLGTTAIPLVCCSGDNKLYFGYGTTEGNVQYGKATFNGTNTITWSQIIGDTISNCKQLLIDKYGDLIILTNTGTASTLLKYTTAGVQVGATLDLGGAFYNLNTDKDGNYYYSNALGTYKITANTAQGQAFSGVGSKIRGSGMTTYGNSIRGYNPAVFGPQE